MIYINYTMIDKTNTTTLIRVCSSFLVQNFKVREKSKKPLKLWGFKRLQIEVLKSNS